MLVRQLNKKWDSITKDYVLESRDNLVELKELGSIVVLAMPIPKLSGVSIMLVPLILHKLNNIHVFSSFIKYEQVQHDFGKILSDTLQDKPLTNVNMAGLDISWNIVRDHFGKLEDSGLTDPTYNHQI
jgi:hypothetical protein